MKYGREAENPAFEETDPETQTRGDMIGLVLYSIVPRKFLASDRKQSRFCV